MCMSKNSSRPESNQYVACAVAWMTPNIYPNIFYFGERLRDLLTTKTHATEIAAALIAGIPSISS